MIDEGTLRSVAVIGVRKGTEDPNWMGTGFSFYATEDVILLATNRHVVEGLRAELARDTDCMAVIGVESSDHNAPVVFELGVDDDEFIFHPDPTVDVAVTFVQSEAALESAGVMPIPLRNQLERRQLLDRGIGEGDDVYVLGFPMNVVAESIHSAIVRHGCIARMRETHASDDCRYLIDAGVYPGNSGGPVFVKADVAGGAAYVLTGIVCAYLPYEDVAVSAQTGSARIIFQENSGLAVVHTVDAIRVATAELFARVRADDAEEGA